MSSQSNIKCINYKILKLSFLNYSLAHCALEKELLSWSVWVGACLVYVVQLSNLI